MTDTHRACSSYICIGVTLSRFIKKKKKNGSGHRRDCPSIPSCHLEDIDLASHIPAR